jgi:hypothetical protein|tara:strand:- start:565 stop:798 length:234 start_codon:yes stop_codon:yes gene_type:complete
MGILGEIFIGFILLFILGTLFRFALPRIVAAPLIILEKLEKLGMPKWISGILGFIFVWGGVGVCLFAIAYVAKFIGW